MSELVGVFGVQHNPLLFRVLKNPVDDDLVALRAAFAETADRLRSVRPDVVVVIATDHLTQWWYDNMPTFLVGRSAQMPATFPNEEREFGLPTATLLGDIDVGAWLHEDGIRRGFDLSGSDDFRVDHSVLVPLQFLTPDLDVPVVPVFTNAIAPPFPTAERFYQLGTMLRRSIEACPLGRRVAILASGHLATEIGGPRQFAGSPDRDFDLEAVEMVRAGAVGQLSQVASFERLLAAGNVTHQFLNFVVAMGAAEGRPATVAEAAFSRFATSPFFAWTGEDLA